jgi:hypothetical protein
MGTTMNVRKQSGNETDIQHGRFPDGSSRPLDDCDAARGDSTRALDDKAWAVELESMRPLFADYDARGAWGFFS